MQRSLSAYDLDYFLLKSIALTDITLNHHDAHNKHEAFTSEVSFTLQEENMAN